MNHHICFIHEAVITLFTKKIFRNKSKSFHKRTIVTWWSSIVFSCSSNMPHQSFLSFFLHFSLFLKNFFLGLKGSVVSRESTKVHIRLFQIFPHCKILCSLVFQPSSCFSVCPSLLRSRIGFYISTKEQMTRQRMVVCTDAVGHWQWHPSSIVVDDLLMSFWMTFAFFTQTPR